MAVARALTSRENLLSSRHGVGKSLGVLGPASLAGPEKEGASTHTINLQEQLTERTCRCSNKFLP